MLSSTHISPPPPPTGTSSKNPSLCKQGHKKASTLICHQFSFSSSATWLDPQTGGGSWLGSSPFLLYLFSLATSPGLPRSLSSLGSLLTASWRREARLHHPSQGQVSDCLLWGSSHLPPSFPPRSLRMGLQMCLSCWRRWGGAVGSNLEVS